MSVQVERHEIYYFDDGNVIFRVENTLFNVHRFFFKRDSPIFLLMFLQPSATPGEGESDNKPIVLEGIKSAHFACFLSCVYPVNYGTGDLVAYDDWAAALELAVLWEFERVRDFIVKRVQETGTLAEQIVTARRLDMQDWCWDVCAKICQRREPLTLIEAQRLGLEDTVRISGVRERRRARPFTEAKGTRYEADRFHMDCVLPMALDDPNTSIAKYLMTTLELPNVQKFPKNAFDDVYGPRRRGQY